MIKKSFYIGISIILSLIIICSVSRADTASDLQAKIAASNNNRDALEKEIANYQKQLNVINNQATSLQNTIKSLDISSSKLSTEIKLTENNINETVLSIQDTNLSIGDKENKISAGNMTIAGLVKQLNESDSASMWEILLAHKNLSEFWNEMENIIQVESKISDQITMVKTVKADLEQKEKDLEQKKSDLEAYNKDLSAQKQILLATKKQKSDLLAVTKNTQSNYNKILAEKKAMMNALDQEISQYESQLRLAIDPKSYPPAGKGILAWPLDTITITQKFGYTLFAKTAYASGYHNGVDFAASIGTRIKSAGNGTIGGIGDTDIVCPGASFGKWVFIRYDNGLASIYGHLSLITATVGQKVKTGDVVGYSGNTGYTTGPHLHMSVYAGQGVKISTLKSAVCRGTYTMPIADPKAYLDPLIYL